MKDTYVSLDLEMTSGRADSQEAVEIGAVKFRGERVIASWSRLVRPSVPLSYSVQILTGIKPDDLTRAPSLSDVAPELLSFVGGYPVVGQTISVDVACLRRQGVVLDNALLDTFELASVLLPRMPSYSLASLAAHFGIAFPRQHRAVADALVTKSLFLALYREALKLDADVLREITRLAAPFDWPLKRVFRDAQAERPGETAGGASIRQQLLAKRNGDDLPLEVLLLAPPPPQPLEPSPERRPASLERLARLLSEDERAASSSTLEVAQAVAVALAEGRRLIVEAPGDAARRLGYVLPSVEYALANQTTVVLSASAPARQDELVSRSLPEAARLLGKPPRLVAVKPRESYLCFRQWTALRRRQDLSLAEALLLIKTLVWLPTTQTGDVAELNLSDEERSIWRSIAVDEDGCDPDSCSYARRGVCFLSRVREAARGAHVVVTSHPVVVSDTRSRVRLLPSHGPLVLDEAHRLEDEATKALACEVRGSELIGRLGDLHGLAELLTLRGADRPRRGQGVPQPTGWRSIGEALGAAAESALQAAQEFASALAGFVKAEGGGDRGFEPRARLTRAARGRPPWQRALVTWQTLDPRLVALAEALRPAESTFQTRSSTTRTAEDEDLGARIHSDLAWIERLVDRLRAQVAEPDPSLVCWVSTRSGDVALHSAPLRVGDVLAHDVFGSREAVVINSDSLSVDGAFDFVADRLGLAGARTLAVRTDSERHPVLVYLPSDVPEPEQPTYQGSLQQALIDLCSATRGRTLVLFTSHGQLRQTWKSIQGRLADRGILVIGQGVEGSGRRNLLHTFSSNPKTVLLATGSFWESVDVPPEALRVLVVPRLPFPPPGDPVIAARSEGLKDPLHEYSLPLAILRLKQGFARLSRVAGAREVFVLFDHRVQSKGYGQVVLRSLPSGEVRVGSVREMPAEVARWLALDERAGDERR